MVLLDNMTIVGMYCDGHLLPQFIDILLTSRPVWQCYLFHNQQLIIKQREESKDPVHKLEYE